MAATLLITILVVLVLIALLAAVDRVLAAAIAVHIGGRVASANDLPARPSVRVLGFPFLTQLASNDYREVAVMLGSLSSGDVELSDLDARFTGVRVSLGRLPWPDHSEITAKQASATVIVPFAVLSQRLPPGLMLSHAGGNLRITSTVLGIGVPGTLALSVSAAGITITPHLTGMPAWSALSSRSRHCRCGCRSPRSASPSRASGSAPPGRMCA